MNDRDRYFRKRTEEENCRMTDELTLRPIAYIQTDFKEKFGVPRQSGRVKELQGRVIFEKEFATREALRGIEEFSHLWLLWGFSLCQRKNWSPTVRPPRLGGNKRVGVFATRSPYRPNPIGLSIVRLEGILEGREGLGLAVLGADLVNGTPIYDIKPYLPFADSAENALGGFADSFKDYALEVELPPKWAEVLPAEKLPALLGVLREDPRPAYQRDERTYGLSFAGFSVSFFVKENRVLRVTEIHREV